jgi:hypothetical protein
LPDEEVKSFETSLHVAAELRKSIKETVARNGTRVHISPDASARIKSLIRRAAEDTTKAQY